MISQENGEGAFALGNDQLQPQLGAMAGAILGETWAGRDADTSWRIAKLAFWGRLAGTLGKIILGAVMIVIVVAAMLV